MTSANRPPADLPLHRLLKRQETEELLAEFASLLPETDLAVIRSDGRLFAGNGAWSPAAVEELLALAGTGRQTRTAGALVRPLRVKSQLVGALVLRSHGPDPGPAAEQALGCLQHSLTLLLDQAAQTRDLVRETLDRYREINLLYHIGETIGGCLDPDEIPRLVLAEAKRVIEGEVGLVMLAPSAPVGENGLAIQASFGAGGDLAALPAGVQQVIREVFESGQPRIVTVSPTAGAGLGALLCAPLKTQEQVLGVICEGRLAGQPDFTAGDEKLLMALAGQAAIALETARLHQEEIKQQRLEEELAIGHEIQLSLLPDAFPVVPGWEFAAIYRPARQVGGDLYDFFQVPGPGKRLGIVIADVTGKGVPAALFMAFSRTLLRTEALNGRQPSSALRRANQSIVRDNRSHLFLSTFYGTLDTETGELVFANAGHNWPLWHQAATGEVQRLTARGIILGIFKNIELEERSITVAPGDLVVFYTDGVTEARDAAGRLFDEERLRAAMAGVPAGSAEQILQAVVQALEDFTGQAPQADDFTIIVVRRQRGD